MACVCESAESSCCMLLRQVSEGMPCDGLMPRNAPNCHTKIPIRIRPPRRIPIATLLFVFICCHPPFCLSLQNWRFSYTAHRLARNLQIVGMHRYFARYGAGARFFLKTGSYRGISRRERVKTNVRNIRGLHPLGGSILDYLRSVLLARPCLYRYDHYLLIVTVSIRATSMQICAEVAFVLCHESGQNILI